MSSERLYLIIYFFKRTLIFVEKKCHSKKAGADTKHFFFCIFLYSFCILRFTDNCLHIFASGVRENYKQKKFMAGLLLWIVCSLSFSLDTRSNFNVYKTIIWVQKICSVLCDLVPFVHLYNLKNVKSTHGGVLLLVKSKSNTPPWAFLTFLKLHKWYQTPQHITYQRLMHVKVVSTENRENRVICSPTKNLFSSLVHACHLFEALM